MEASEIIGMTALEISQAIKDNKCTVREAVTTFLGRISEVDKAFNSIITVPFEKIEERITEVEEGIKNGRYNSHLAGVPIVIKDNICTEGIRTTCGSKMLMDFIPSYNATVIEKILDAGMIIIGKSNMDEFAMGSTTESSYFGATKNPWNEGHVSGGSSGGSCVAVSLREVPLALGSDTGGSIRQPASYCGVAGFKPTYGRVSRYGLVAYASSLDQIGPIGRNVRDCEALFNIIAGADEKDSTSMDMPLTNRNVSALDIKNMKIAIPNEYISEENDDAVKAVVLKAADLLKKKGAEVEFISLKYADYAVAAYYIIACAEASSNLERFDGVKYGYRDEEAVNIHDLYKKSRSEGFGEEVKRRILLGSFVLSEGFYEEYYIKALKVKRLIKNEFDEVFKKYDCILAPVAPFAAPKLGTSLEEPLKMYLSDVYTVAVNLCGLPAISVPLDVDKKGLPVGVQLIGDMFKDSLLLNVAGELEKERGDISILKEDV